MPSFSVTTSTPITMAADKKNPSKKVEIRWGIPQELHRKIAVYQKSHGIKSIELAGNILLQKVTSDIVLAEK